MEEVQIWFQNKTGVRLEKPDIEEAPSILSKIHPIFLLQSNAEIDRTVYWNNIHSIAKLIVEDIRHPNIDFNGFIERLMKSEDVLNKLNHKDLAHIFRVADDTADIKKFLWNYCTNNENIINFIRAVSFLSKSLRGLPPIFGNSSNVDFIIDNFGPSMDACYHNDKSNLIIPRILMCDAIIGMVLKSGVSNICSELVDFLFRRYLNMASNDSGIPGIYAFRSACALYKILMEKDSKEEQASKLLRLVKTFPGKNAHHCAAVKFAMLVKPEVFGFVTLAKFLLKKRTVTHFDIAFVDTLLSQRYTKNPTDVFLKLLKLSVNHKIYSECAKTVLLSSFNKYFDVEGFRGMFELFVRRCLLFCCLIKSKTLEDHYIEQKIKILLLMRSLLNLNIDWVTDMIQNYSTAAYENGLDEVSDIRQGEPPEIFNKEFQTEHINIEMVIVSIKTDLPLLIPSTSPIEKTPKREGTGKKLTIAEVKRRYKERMKQGFMEYVAPNDLSLLENPDN